MIRREFLRQEFPSVINGDLYNGKTTDVIIPTYRPGKEFGRLIERLQKQSCPIHRIIIMNTEEKFWNKEWDEKYPFLEVHHIPKAEFDHGGTRKKQPRCLRQISWYL